MRRGIEPFVAGNDDRRNGMGGWDGGSGKGRKGRGRHGGAAEEDIIMGRAWPRASEVAEDERGKEKFVKGNGARERNGANERTNASSSRRRTRRGRLNLF